MKRKSPSIKRNAPRGLRMTGSLRYAVLCALAVPALIIPTQAAVQSSARSVAMGGAYTALARGPEAGKFNPANLGLTDYREFGIELVGLGVNISNNSFTLSDYNKYTGAFLTDADKAYLLDKIPDEGLRLNADIRANALSVSAGQFGFNVTGVGVADINLSKDIFELVFNGNTFADTISVDGSYSDMYSYAAAGLSYGLPIYNSGTRQLAVGATFKYLYGIADEEVVELQGLAATFASGFEGEGRMIARTATGGRGYALDVGASLQLSESYTVGARLENLLGSISWNDQTEEHGYIFSFDTMTVDNMEEDYVISDDYTRAIGSYSTRLPATLTVGFARTSGRLVWAVDWQQGLSRKPGVSTTPLLAIGAEFSLLSFLPLRAGFTTGGDRNSTISFGSGVNYNPIYIDFALATGPTFSGYGSKGLNFAVSMGLTF